jgi:molybdopterin molybdotransferase
LSGGDAEERWIDATLTAPLEANGPREFYQPAKLLEDRRVTPLQWKGSADIYTLARANALLVRAENEPPRAAGESVRLMEL